MAFPPRISLSGTNYEIGYNHGKLLKDQIVRQINLYYQMFESLSKLDREGVHNRASEYEATIKKLAPNIHLELVGIAEGAGVDLVDIVALNVRSEIALGEFKDGCTSISWKIVGEDEIKQHGKPTIKIVTEAGIVGKIGYNDASVGVLLNALRSSPVDTSKLPIHIILRLCLECSSTTEAISLIEKYGVASAQHILIADPNVASGLELSPIQSHYMTPNSDGFLAHTNHPIENMHIKETMPFAGSKDRLARSYELMKEIPPTKASVEMLRDIIFSDKANGNYAICGPECPDKPTWTRTMTLFNIVMQFRLTERPIAKVVFTTAPDGLFDKNIIDL
ncbi:hypothetical protein H072_2115 [Dactylellina haptotyla CBS 200.50]|uniref:Peptidase C45 hydrolase domain-containing protein n=1 Tax=Dactylellina haptotyla (strain CBS 200.50) TaxID=1284197 RepID=S8BWS0_DACHA|nr:hypothetical protein H072_2115 [Dactylellina haptotyla CBS 200.50]